MSVCPACGRPQDTAIPPTPDLRRPREYVAWSTVQPYVRAVQRDPAITVAGASPGGWEALAVWLAGRGA